MTGAGSPGRRAGTRFADLRTRLLSAAVLLAIGAVSVWWGGLVFDAVVVAIGAAMTWELARLTAPDRPGQAMVFALAVAGAVAGAAARPWWPETAVLALGPALFLITPRRDVLLAAAWTLMVELACLGLIALRDGGAVAALWLIGIVVVSDAMGYFAGRMIGGPKFWPKLSPKKTWSGTVAGWFGAAIWSLVVLGASGQPMRWELALLAAVFAFAGQLADLFESWMKRRAGVKDVSQLIPGHGGVMDRFDAITGAAALAMVAAWLAPLALGG